jgi:hypothetical protein
MDLAGRAQPKILFLVPCPLFPVPCLRAFTYGGVGSFPSISHIRDPHPHRAPKLDHTKGTVLRHNPRSQAFRTLHKPTQAYTTLRHGHQRSLLRLLLLFLLLVLVLVLVPVPSRSSCAPPPPLTITTLLGTHGATLQLSLR